MKMLFQAWIALVYFLGILRRVAHSLEVGARPVFVAGATGYIGRAVVKELISRGVPTIAAVRKEAEVAAVTQSYLLGSTVKELSIVDSAAVDECFSQTRPGAVICCAASRNGLPKESWEVDYGGGKNLLQSLIRHGDEKTSTDMPHYVMLSAFCCGKPRLQFQFAKLKLEEDLREASKEGKGVLSHSIVRPTAYFKSLDGQLEAAKKGSSVMYFGDGTCSANAIGDKDLAKFLVDCALSPGSIGMVDATRNVGGPDVPAVTKLQQIGMLFDVLKTPEDERKTMSIPVGVFDVLLGVFSFAKKVTETFGARELATKCDDAGEIVNIVKYYATEPMVATGDGEVQGSMRLSDHFQNLKGGLREVDQYTTTMGVVDLVMKQKYESSKSVFVGGDEIEG